MKRSYLVRSVIVVLCLLISLWQTEFSLPLLWERGHYFIDTVGRMFPPDTSFLDVILVPLRDTVYISFWEPFLAESSEQRGQYCVTGM